MSKPVVKENGEIFVNGRRVQAVLEHTDGSRSILVEGHLEPYPDDPEEFFDSSEEQECA